MTKETNFMKTRDTDGRSYVVANCNGCEENPEGDFLYCVGTSCKRLEYPSSSTGLTLLGGSEPGMTAELHEYASPSFGVWGDPALVLSITMPDGSGVDVWLDKGELLSALGAGDPGRPEVVRKHMDMEERHPSRTMRGGAIFAVESEGDEEE